jgi:hypothetical protein
MLPLPVRHPGLLRHPGEGLAKAGIHPSTSALSAKWISAFAGMTFLFLFLCVSASLW